MMHLFGMSLLDRINRLRRRQAHRRAKEPFEKRLLQRLSEAHHHGFDEQVNRSPKAEIRSPRFHSGNGFISKELMPGYCKS
jgi:hypothetical protein